MKMERRWRGKKIEIGGIIYAIKYFAKNKFSNKGKVETKAEICMKDRTIWLKPGMPQSEEIQSLIHELIHGVIDILIPAKILAEIEEEEELIVEPFSRMFTGALRSAGLLRE